MTVETALTIGLIVSGFKILDIVASFYSGVIIFA